jgi:hypothetical protein
VPDLFGDSKEEEGDERRSSSPPKPPPPPPGVGVPRFSSADRIGEMVTGCMTGEIRKLAAAGLLPSVRVRVSEAGKEEEEEGVEATTAGVMDTLLRLTGSLLLTGRWLLVLLVGKRLTLLLRLARATMLEQEEEGGGGRIVELLLVFCGWQDSKVNDEEDNEEDDEEDEDEEEDEPDFSRGSLFR